MRHARVPHVPRLGAWTLSLADEGIRPFPLVHFNVRSRVPDVRVEGQAIRMEQEDQGNGNSARWPLGCLLRYLCGKRVGGMMVSMVVGLGFGFRFGVEFGFRLGWAWSQDASQDGSRIESGWSRDRWHQHAISAPSGYHWPSLGA